MKDSVTHTMVVTVGPCPNCHGSGHELGVEEPMPIGDRSGYTKSIRMVVCGVCSGEGIVAITPVKQEVSAYQKYLDLADQFHTTRKEAADNDRRPKATDDSTLQSTDAGGAGQRLLAGIEPGGLTSSGGLAADAPNPGSPGGVGSPIFVASSKLGQLGQLARLAAGPVVQDATGGAFNRPRDGQPAHDGASPTGDGKAAGGQGG